MAITYISLNIIFIDGPYGVVVMLIGLLHVVSFNHGVLCRYFVRSANCPKSKYDFFWLTFRELRQIYMKKDTLLEFLIPSYSHDLTCRYMLI